MIKDIFDNYGIYIYIGLGVIIVVVIILLVARSILNREPEEDTSSILDVDIDGVVDKDFNYGYENEDTVVMKRKDLKEKKKKTKKTDK